MFVNLNSYKGNGAFNCETIVFSSSATVYGSSEISPIKESLKSNLLILWPNKSNN